jgi:hypothetical protein
VILPSSVKLWLQRATGRKRRRSRGAATQSGQLSAEAARSGAKVKLARAAGVGLATLQRIEQSEGVVKGNFAKVLKIQNAPEQAGIHFTDDEAGEIGVCLSAP